MFTIDRSNTHDREQNYKHMLAAVKSQLETESDVIANLSNITAFINAYMDRLNWVGFYIRKNAELVLGPFQGVPACIRIQIGKGVCGTAAQKREIIRVDDVHTFAGHIACDTLTNSEIVLPVFKRDELFGVLDLDSPDFSRFGDLEEYYLSKVAEAIGQFLHEQKHE